METLHPRTTFYRATLSALFAGIMATLLCLGYDIAYRDETGFSLSPLINVSSIIFIVNIIFLIVGIAYSFILTRFKRADLIFTIAFLLLIVFCIWRVLNFQRSPIHAETVQFRGLLIGILIILAIAIAAIPFLFHNRKFEETVL
jgi:hypothetical protein